MSDDELIYELERSHKFQTYNREGSTLNGAAARRIRELLVEVERLTESVEEYKVRVHHLNEDLLQQRSSI